MSSFLNAATAYLGEELKSHESETVVYRRGARVVTGGIAATIGETRYETSDQVAIIGIDSRDFIFQAADLVINGVQTTPQPGDQIDRTINDETQTYEVMSPEGVQCFSFCDRDETRIRAHTNKVTVG